MFVLFPSLLFGQLEDSQTDSLRARVNIYPNPVSEVLYIESNEYPTFAGIADDRGVIIGYIDIVWKVQAIDLSGFEPGNYFLIIKDVSYRIRIK